MSKETNTCPFNMLIIGDTFDFVSGVPGMDSFFQPCWKTGARTYQELRNPARSYTVGSTGVQVYHVNEYIRTTVNGVSNPPGSTIVVAREA